MKAIQANANTLVWALMAGLIGLFIGGALEQSTSDTRVSTPTTIDECYAAVAAAQTRDGVDAMVHYCMARFPGFLATPTQKATPAPEFAIHYLQNNPHTWREFKNQFGYLPADFRHPRASKEDIEYLRANPYNIQKFIKHYGYDPSDELLRGDSSQGEKPRAQVITNTLRQDAQGVTEDDMTADSLLALQEYLRARFAANLLNYGADQGLSKAEREELEVVARTSTWESHYVQAAGKTVAVVRARAPDTLRAAFVSGLNGSEWITVSCIRRSDDYIAIASGPCADQIRADLGVSLAR